ncbi:hypothetical protein MTO96_008256 [Rhipicephalus appendiculatus]
MAGRKSSCLRGSVQLLGTACTNGSRQHGVLRVIAAADVTCRGTEAFITGWYQLRQMAAQCCFWQWLEKDAPPRAVQKCSAEGSPYAVTDQGYGG